MFYIQACEPNFGLLMTLIFDLLTLEVDSFTLFTPWTTYANLQPNRFIHFGNNVLATDEPTDRRNGWSA